MTVDRIASKAKTYLIPIRQIVVNHNHRNPVSRELQSYTIFLQGNGQPSLWELATSDRADERARYVRLIQERDPELAALASNILAFGQLEPAEVRDNGKRKSDGQNTYTLVFGCRRCLAILFNWCSLGKPQEPVVEAKLVKGNEVTLLHRTISENDFRKQPNAIEVAQSLQWALNNGESKASLAQQYGVSKQTIANRLALLELPLDVQQRIAAGKLSPSKALDKAQGRNGEAVEAKPKLRSRLEIEQAYGEFTADSAEGRVLGWLLRKRENIQN
jgi:ParB/RepB/Spo0J family partition protein